MSKSNATTFEGLKLSSDGALIVEVHFFGGNLVDYSWAHHVFVVLKLSSSSSRTTNSSSYVLLERMKDGIYCQYADSLEDAIKLRAQGPGSERKGWGRPWKAADMGSYCMGFCPRNLQEFIDQDKSIYHCFTNNCRKFALEVCKLICDDAYQAARKVLPEFLW